MLPEGMLFRREIELVEDRIRAALRADSGLFALAARRTLEGQGKKLRPRIVLLVRHASGAQGPSGEREIAAAAAVELVHVASLIHDDVIDRAATRRGRPSLNAEYGNDVAILMADYLYAQAFEMAIDAVGPDILQLLCRVTRQMCRSEILQIEKRGELISEGDYLRIIDAKTAALFAAAAEIGGILAGADEALRQALAEFGRHIGMAYQITDDFLDYAGAAPSLGKPTGNDLAQGKQTLPLLHACTQASEDERRQVVQTLNNGREMSRIMPLIRKYGGLEYAEGRAREFASEARSAIASLPGARASEPMRQLCDFVVDRSS